MKRKLSTQAQVAKICRQYVKSLGLKCTARSESFSMGDSVDVRVENANGQQRKLIDTELEKYQYGRFNGMEDIYEYSNTREDIPQTKYLSIHYHYTADYQQAAYDWTKAHYMDSEQLSTMPELYEDADSNTRLHNEWLSTIIYQVLNGSKTRYEGEEARTFWDDYKPAKPAPKPAPKVEAGEVHEIMHTKKGVNIYIVTLPSMEREEFTAMRDHVRNLGGWYSRKFGNSPAGFAFNTREEAESFAAGA